MKPTTLINCFEVPVGREDEFYALWSQVNRYQQSQPGYIYNRLHRSVSPGARFRFINVVGWESLEHFQRAIASEGFKSVVGNLGSHWAEFPKVLDAFEVIEESQA